MSDVPAVDELIRLRTDALFRHDQRGRTLVINQWDGGEPPRFYLARAATHEEAVRTSVSCACSNVCRVRADVSDEVAQALRRLAEDEPPLWNVMDPPVHASEYARLLGREAGDIDAGGPVYWFAVEWFHDHEIPDRPTVPIDATNAHLLRGGLDAWLPDVPHRQPMVAVVEDGRTVSICASVRITGRSHEAGVETVADRRRRGHAAAAVAGWAHEVRRRGVSQVFYSTSWQNVASRAVADRLALAPIGADFSVK